jgi:opacity protein-like surface antigen
MRPGVLALTLAGVAVAAVAHAGGVDFGPRFAISVPTGDAGISMSPGLNAGVTATFMGDGLTGFSMDVAYHRWPGSSSANAAIDDLFSRLGGSTITGSKLTFSAIQFTGQLRVAPRVSGAVAPWIQVGAGIYRTNAHLDLPWDQLRAAGWTVVESGNGDSISHEFGYLGTLGIDFKVSANMKFGLDASYHHVLWGGELDPDLNVFTVGARLLR